MHMPRDPQKRAKKQANLAKLGTVAECDQTGKLVGPTLNSQQMNQERSWISENGWKVVGQADGKSIIAVSGPTLAGSPKDYKDSDPIPVTTPTVYFLADLRG
jgi:hypothetical protein